MIGSTFPVNYRIRVLWNRARYFLAGMGIIIYFLGVINIHFSLIVMGIVLILPSCLSLAQDIEWCKGYIDLVTGSSPEDEE